MAQLVLTNADITVNGVVLSNRANSVELNYEVESVEVTAFGGNRSFVGGLQNNTITIQFMQDFGSSSVDATLFPLLNTLATVVIVPTSGTITSTNPSYTATCLVNSYSPFASSVGDIATLSVTWPTSGTISRGTSA